MFNWSDLTRPVSQLLTGNDATPSSEIAAIDLGSNSFHLLVAEPLENGWLVADRVKESVRLAAGLNADNDLDPEARSRALACLERFRQRLKDIPNRQIRAVGTNTLRRADQASGFIADAEAALGAEIQIISGQEEARLVWNGACHDLGDAPPRRIVIDIGGGSTEIIYGEEATPVKMTSLQIGCVALTQRFFAHGELSPARFAKAVRAAEHALAPIAHSWRSLTPDIFVGSSGTALAIAAACDAQRVTDGGTASGQITASCLEKLTTELLRHDTAESLSIEGVSESRRPVFAAGLAAMTAVFNKLGIETMSTVQSALREGLLEDILADLQGRNRTHETREATVNQLAKRYGVDEDHATRVRNTAQQLFDASKGAWELDPNQDASLLSWAADLHEIGKWVDFRGYHKHGAYLIAASSLIGFSARAQQQLAFLVRHHRRRMPETLPEDDQATAWRLSRLLILLRLAVLLNRSRSAEPIEFSEITASDNRIELIFTNGWLADHPLTEADLAAQAELLAAFGTQLEFS